MIRSIPKLLMAILLLVSGGVAIIYGTAMRTVPVWATVMVEKEEIELVRPPALSWNGPPGLGGNRPNMPPPPPVPRKVKKSVAEDREQRHREPRLIQDVTIGGVARLGNGRLTFTYGPGEKGPALCPT